MADVSHSQLMNKLKTRTKGAWKKARKVEPKARGAGGLPPGLKDCIAVCKEYKFAGTKKGDPYFTLTGIVQAPEELANRRATISWFINDSEWSTAEAELEKMTNDLALIYDEDLPDTIDGLPDVLKELCERGVHFVFTTGQERKGGKAPNVFIQGLADGWEDANAGTEASNGEAHAEAEDEVEDEEEPEDEEEEETTDEEEEDAEAEDESSSEAGDDESEVEEEPWEPAKGDHYGYTPPKSKSVLEVMVGMINKKAETVDVTTVKPDKKTKKKLAFKGVKWDKLQLLDE